MLQFILQYAERIGIVTFLSLLIAAFWKRILLWGWQYDKDLGDALRLLKVQEAQTDYFKDLARRYAALAQVSIDVAELLPVPPARRLRGGPDSTEGQVRGGAEDRSHGDGSRGADEPVSADSWPAGGDGEA